MANVGYGLALDTILSDIRKYKLAMSRHELIGRYLGRFPLKIIKWAIDTIIRDKDEFVLENITFADFSKDIDSNDIEMNDFIGDLFSPRWSRITGEGSPWCEVTNENHD